MKKDILIMGVGNILQFDDGIGVHIVNHMLDTGITVPDDVELLDGGTAGYDLIPYMTGKRKIIIVDALKADDVPGSIYRFTPDHLVGEERTFSLHDMGMRTILKTLELLGERPQVEIIGIVPEDIATFDIGMSTSVKEAIPRAVEQILDATIH